MALIKAASWSLILLSWVYSIKNENWLFFSTQFYAKHWAPFKAPDFLWVVGGGGVQFEHLKIDTLTQCLGRLFLRVYMHSYVEHLMLHCGLPPGIVVYEQIKITAFLESFNTSFTFLTLWYLRRKFFNRISSFVIIWPHSKALPYPWKSWFEQTWINLNSR